MMRRAKEAQKAGAEEPNIPLFYLNLRFDCETKRRWATLENMSKLLRDYEGEYHYLYCLVYSYSRQPNPTSEHFLLLPNAIRKVMETYLLFKVPGNNNFGAAIGQMAATVPEKPKFYALQKFAEMEGHGEDLTAITQPATLTIEEAHPAAQELIALIAATDQRHADEMRKLCEKVSG